MTTLPDGTSSYRPAGRAAIFSGLIGILAYILLTTAVLTRTTLVPSVPVYMMFRLHDCLVVLQFLLMTPLVKALYDLSQQGATGMTRRMRNIGLGALWATAIFLVLGLVKFFSDGAYTVSQGVFGIWMIAVCWKLRSLLPAWLCWFGMIVGLGLAITATFFPLYAIFVNTLILHIPAADPSTFPESFTPFNAFLHKVIWVGSIMGMMPFPVWTLITGIVMMRRSWMRRS